MNYKNVQINEEVTIKGEKVTGCYLVIDKVYLNQVSDLKARFHLSFYRTKDEFVTSALARVKIDEMPLITEIIFSSDFNQGDLFEKISSELKTKILSLNPTWLPENVVIEA